MADAPDIAILVEKIEARDASAVPAITALSDRCQVDGHNRTLFDVAILANNAEVIALLASDADALEFAPPVDEKNTNQMRNTAASFGIDVPVSKLEAMLEKSFGQDVPYGRAPLHSACRAGNAEAMQTLLAAGARIDTRDVMGLTAAELAFYAHGEPGLRDFVAAFKRSDRASLPVGKRLLRETFAFPDVMEELLAIGKLDSYARRLLFCYRCAWLDIDAVQTLLAEGHDPNKGVTSEINPVWNACTSALLWDEAIPGGLDMAFHYTKHLGHPDASSISVDNALLNEDGSNFGKLFSEAQRKQSEQKKMVSKMTIDPEVEQDVIARRIRLLDVLLAAGADVPLARKKLEFPSFGELKQMNLGAVADRLKQRGKNAAPPEKKKKPAASTWWEVPVETGLNVEYWPVEGAGGLLRLALSNTYGPIDGVTLCVSLSRDESKPADEWSALTPVAETIDVDGEVVARASLTEKVYGETPWEAVYELSLDKAGDEKVLWIRLDHDEYEELAGELDPWRFAKD
ncbi:MAG: hypothetical protein QNJ05_09835 [Woeseiaceae bacterium]|nr:hypothetical protein [Woeseiaceae bacterium]